MADAASYDVAMPQLGETVTEGTITRWFKKVGDQVVEDEPLFEVSTDKVDSEVPAATGGYLAEILVAEGETVDVGARLAVIADTPPSNGANGRTQTTAEPEAEPAGGAPPAEADPDDAVEQPGRQFRREVFPVVHAVSGPCVAGDESDEGCCICARL